MCLWEGVTVYFLQRATDAISREIFLFQLLEMVTFYCALALGQKCDFSQNLVKVVYEVNKTQVRAFENFCLDGFSSSEQNYEDQSLHIFLKVLLSRKHVWNGTTIFSEFLRICFSSWSPVEMFCMKNFPEKKNS